MSVGASLRPQYEMGLFLNHGRSDKFKIVEMKSRTRVVRFPFSSRSLRQDSWNLHVSDRISRRLYYTPHKCNVFVCQSFAIPSSADKAHLLKMTTSALTRSYTALQKSPIVIQLLPAVGIIAFAVWGLGPLMRIVRKLFLQRNDSNWKQSRTHYVFTSYLQPFLLWTGAIFICNVLDPIVLLSEESQVIMQRLLSFVRSLSTVLAFSYCLSNLIQQTQKFFMENNSNDTRNMGFQFAGKAVYTAVWVAAASLFMELLGFSTQKWLTAGGLGTVLLTLAGREIFTNFLSSIMIHATRPFVVNEWIQTKIEGYEVSGTVEHVGWWSPTIIRGEDREAIHIPNHQFTVNVVRNISQKTHWRIKTHLAISHLDVNKLNNIVADMRKVLAKNPQVEHKRLHRRVFLENINPENQALMILVSCFVKTSHIEEYMCVKEAILLDLLRVISHHGARLATPIRTMQKIYVDPNLENVPFSETIFSRYGASSNRPMLLMEPATRINGSDKTKARTSQRANEEQTRKTTAASEPKLPSVSEGTVKIIDQLQQKPESGDTVSHTVNKVDSSAGPASNSSKQQHEILEADELGSNVGSERPPLSEASSEKPLLSEAGSEQDGTLKVHAKHDTESLTSAPPPTPRPTLEDNILLGAVLDGSKRTLPIEEGMSPTSNPAGMKELAAMRNGIGSSCSIKDKEEIPATSSSAATDPREKER